MPYRDIKYWGERMYPYLCSGVITAVFYRDELNFVTCEKMPDAIAGVITVAALIIGFIGAMLPVLVAMRKDSEFVHYVLKVDRKHLLLKYLKAMLLSGLLLITLSIMLYFEGEVPDGLLEKYGFYGWIFLLFCFWMTTYRCISRILKLVFEEGVIPTALTHSPKETEREIEHRKRLREGKKESD